MSEHVQPARNESKRLMSMPKDSGEWVKRNWFERKIPLDEGEVGAGMSEQIQAGDGWRLLGPDEVLRHGDEMLFYVDGKPYWLTAPDTCFNEPKAKHFPYRRRIPAKPEAMEIWNAFKVECGYSPDQWAILQAGPPDCAGDVVVGNAAEARQLADWLTRYAAWREAQDAAK